MSSLRVLALAGLACAFSPFSPSTYAADSTLDSAFVTTVSPGVTPESYPTFSTGTGAVNAVTLQSDGKILLGGNVSRYKAPPAGTLQTSLKRLNADGSLDAAFDAVASTLLDSQGQTEINELLTVAGDKVYVGGIFTSYQGTARSGILRLNADGTLDTSFAAVGLGNSTAFGVRYAFALAEQPDGKVLVGGGFNLANGTYRPNLARFHADGSLDTTFNPTTALATSGSVGDIDVLPDGKILVGTNLSIGNFTYKAALLRLNADGSLDSSFQVSFLNEAGNVQQVLPLPDGRIIISGFLALPGYEANPAAGFIAAINPDGTPDASFISNLGTGPNGWVGGELTLQPDGTLLAGGIFNSWNGQPRASVARIQPDGTLDPALAVAPYETDRNQYLTHFYDFAVQPDGKIVAGGWFSRVTDPALETYNITRINNAFAPASPGVLRLLSTTATTAENAGAITLQVSRFGGLVGAVSVNFATSNNTAVAGADYTSAAGTLSWAAGEGGVKTFTVPVLQDTAVEPSETFTVTLSAPTGGATIAPDRTQTVVTIRDDDSAPVITRDPVSVTRNQGDSFTLSVRYDSVLPATIQWQRDPDGAGPLPFADVPFATGFDYTVLAADPEVHSGDYRAVVTNQAGGSPQSATSASARVTINIPAGSLSPSFLPSNIGVLTTAAPDTSGRILAVTTTGLRRLGADGVVEPTTSFGVTFTGATALLPLADGRTLVGGSFTSQTHQPSSTSSSIARLVRLNADATGSIDTNFSLGLTNAVTALAAGASDKVYVGLAAASTTGNGLLRFLANGTADPTWTPAVNTLATGSNGTVIAVRELPDGKVLVSHRHGAGSGTYRLSRLTATGALDPTFGTGGSIDFGTSNWIMGFDVLPDGRIAVAARFNSNLFATGQRYLALLHPDGSFDPSLQFGVGILDANPTGLAYRDGRLLVWGAFTTVNGAVQGNLARFNLDGSLDPTFAIGDGSGAPFGRTINTAFYTASGDIFIGGNFTIFKFSSRNNAALLAGAPQIGAIGFDPARVTQLDSAASLTLTLRRYGSATEAVSVDYATAAFTGSGFQTATAGQDYLAASGTVSWAAGDSADKTVALTVIPDGLVEPTEAMRVVLSNPTGPATVAASATVVLIDANTPVTFTTQPTGATLTEGQGLTLAATVTSPTAMTYQWYRNDEPISGATTTTYTVAATSGVDTGTYFLRVTNAAGFFDTTPVIVTVALDPARRVAAFNFTTALNSNVRSLALIPGAGAYVGGDFTSVPGLTGGRYLVRINDDGSLDPSYNPAPSASVLTMARQPDGKLVIGGSFTQVGGVARAYVARLHIDGTLDTAFSTNLGAGPNSTVNSLALLPDGRIVIGGSFTGINSLSGTSYLAVLKADGSLDTSFTSVANNAVNAVAVQPDGKILIGGTFTTYNTRLGRVSTAGVLDPSFASSGAGTNSVINKIVVLPDNRIAVLGTNLTGGSDFQILNPDGSVAQNISTAATFFDVVAQDNGKLVAIGSFTSGGTRIARYTATGSPATYALDNTFATGSGLNNIGYALAVSPTGQLWIGGAFTSYNGVAVNRLIKLNGEPVAVAITTQPADVTVNPAATLTFSVAAIGTSPLTYQWRKDGLALADGARISGATSPSLAITGATEADEGDYTVVVTNSTAARTATSTAAVAVVLGAPEILVTPAATELNAGTTLTLSATVRGVAPLTYAWRRNGQLLANGGRISGADSATLAITTAEVTDGGAYTLTVTNALGFAATQSFEVSVLVLPGLRVPAFTSLAANSTVYHVLPLPDGGALVAGNFNTTSGLTGANSTAGGPYLARVKPNGEIDSTFTASPNNEVHRLALAPDGGVIAAGSFSQVGGLTRNRLFRLNPDLTLDSTWTQSGFTLPGVIRALAVDSTGLIYVGATYQGFSNANVNIAERFLPDGTRDSAFTWSGNNAIYHIDDILIDAQDRVLLAGNSQSSLGSQGLMRVLPSGAIDPTFQLGVIPGSGSVIRQIGLQSDGKIIVGSSSAPGLRRLSADGVTDNTFTNFNTAVSDFVVLYNDRLVAVGGSISGSGVSALARFDANGTPATFPGATSGFNGSPETISVADTGTLWIGGLSFSTYNGQTATRIVALNGDVPNLHFSKQPAPTTVLDPGASVVFTARAVGTSAIFYQWLKDGVALANGPRLSGTTTATLTITGLVAGDTARYTLRATNDTGGTRTSAAAHLIVRDAPVITVPVSSLTRTSGEAATFSVGIVGVAPISYQWKKNGVTIPGAESATFTLPSVNRLDAGLYSVTVTNSLGSLTSPAAALSVGTRPDYAAVKIDTGGTFDEFRVVAPLPDGRYYVAGSFGSLSGHPTYGLARFLADGSIDTSFTSPFNGGTATVLAAFPDGRVFVHGLSGSGFFGAHQLLNADGTRATFGSTALSNIVGSAQTAAVGADGNIYVSYTYASGGGNRPMLVKLSPTGEVLASFIGDGSGGIYDFGFLSGNRIIVAGNWTKGGLTRYAEILDASFVPDPTFATTLTLNNRVFDLAVLSDGDVLLGGQFNVVNGVSRSLLARINQDGTLDTSFLSGLTGPNGSSIGDIVPAGDGKLLLLGSGTQFNGTVVNNFVRIDESGVIDPTYPRGTSPNIGQATSGYANAALVRADGSILLAGYNMTFKGVALGGLGYLTAPEDGTLAIVAAPSALSEPAGSPVTLAVAARGAGPLTFQWFKDNVAIPGATATSYAIPSLGEDDAASYTVTVTSGANTQTTAPATVAIGTDAPFDAFLADAGVPEGQRGPTDDPDGDGIPNLLEFALGLSPTASDPDGLPVPAAIGDTLTLTYIRAESAAVDYVVEMTTDLGNPTAWTSVGIDQGTPAGDGVTTASVPLGTGPRFLRLRVTLKP